MIKLNFGLFAEYVAYFIYKIKFYQILHHRKRNYAGEIDLIALRGRNLVFIEVKARKSNIDDRLVSYNQRSRIKKAAEVFISRNQKYQNHNIRFDLVIIKPYKWPQIIKNAW